MLSLARVSIGITPAITNAAFSGTIRYAVQIFSGQNRYAAWMPLAYYGISRAFFHMGKHTVSSDLPRLQSIFYDVALSPAGLVVSDTATLLPPLPSRLVLQVPCK